MKKIELINPVEWFKQKGFTFDDKLTVADVIELQQNARQYERQEHREAIQEERRMTAAEYAWQQSQGDDYGSF